MTATKSALDDIHPSMTAPASPDRLTRLRQRTRWSFAASAKATLEVPSGESSSTTIISHGRPLRTTLMRSKRIGMLADSWYVGTMIESAGIDGPDVCIVSHFTASLIPIGVD